MNLSLRRSVALALTILLCFAPSVAWAQFGEEIVETPNNPEHTHTLSWVAPDTDVDGFPLAEIGLSYAIYGSKDQNGVFSMIEDDIQATFFGFTAPEHCFYAYVTATRLDFGVESAPSNIIEWCPGEIPNEVVQPDTPQNLQLYSIDPL